MKRRNVIALLGSIVMWPLGTDAQPLGIPVVGYLSNLSADVRVALIEAFREGLKEFGFIDGQNVRIEYRFADNQNDKLTAMASDLVARKVDVIVASGGNHSIQIAKALTSTIPIVFTTGLDPVKAGFVTSLNRPDANVTGSSFFSVELGAKHIELAHELMPHAKRLAVIVNKNNQEAEFYVPIAQSAARALDLSLQQFSAGNGNEIDAAFAEIARQQVDAVLVAADPFFTARAGQFAELAARNAIPLICANRDYALAGGLVSYGNNPAEAYRSAGTYVGRILKGAKPVELPISRATKFELILNAKTAKALGIAIPITLSAAADEIIE
jgi:putative ABC transport system substrate-binding protein